MHQNFELVTKDYYTDELRYQDKIDAMNNANKISSVVIDQNNDKVSIQLPKEIKGLATSGQLWFYCPVNSVNDRKIPLQVNDEGVMLIDKSKIARSNYQVKLNWQIGKEQYYTEKSLTVN
jgi:hypothetical protein